MAVNVNAYPHLRWTQYGSTWEARRRPDDKVVGRVEYFSPDMFDIYIDAPLPYIGTAQSLGAAKRRLRLAAAERGKLLDYWEAHREANR